MKIPDFLLCVLDTQLWAVNNARVDVLAQSVFYKLGGVTLAKSVHEPDDDEHGGKRRAASDPSLPLRKEVTA